MKTVGLLIGLWECMLLTGCSANEPTPPADQANLRANGQALAGPGLMVELRLTANGDQRRDRIVITTTATNKSRELVAWDRKFIVHLHWRVKGEKDEAVEWERITMADGVARYSARSGSEPWRALGSVETLKRPQLPVILVTKASPSFFPPCFWAR
jgi:hypothetical protein